MERNCPPDQCDAEYCNDDNCPKKHWHSLNCRCSDCDDLDD